MYRAPTARSPWSELRRARDGGGPVGCPPCAWLSALTLVAHLATRVPAFDLPFPRARHERQFSRGYGGGRRLPRCAPHRIACSSGDRRGDPRAGRTFFAGSLYAEVSPLNDLFFACLLFFGAIIERDEPKRGGVQPPHARSTRVAALTSAVTAWPGVRAPAHDRVGKSRRSPSSLTGLLRYAGERPRAAGALVLVTLALGRSLRAHPLGRFARAAPSWGDSAICEHSISRRFTITASSSRLAPRPRQGQLLGVSTLLAQHGQALARSEHCSL